MHNGDGVLLVTATSLSPKVSTPQFPGVLLPLVCLEWLGLGRSGPFRPGSQRQIPRLERFPRILVVRGRVSI